MPACLWHEVGRDEWAHSRGCGSVGWVAGAANSSHGGATRGHGGGGTLWGKLGRGSELLLPVWVCGMGGGHRSTLDWRPSEVLQRHGDTITKVLRGMGSALSHSRALPVQVMGEGGGGNGGQQSGRF